MGPCLNGQLGRGGPLVVVQVLHAGCKVIKAVLLLQEVPVLPPVIAILSTAPASMIRHLVSVESRDVNDSVI